MSVYLLGMSGRQGSGKDTAIRALQGSGKLNRTIGAVVRDDGVPAAVRTVAVQRIEWACALKAAAREWYGLDQDQIEGHLKEIVDPKWGKSPREIMRLLGTEVGRVIHPETWTRYLVEQELPRAVRNARRALHVLRSEFGANIDPETHRIVVCVSGTRFPNEVAAVRAHGGRVVRVVRPGHATDDTHESETRIDHLDVDAEVINNASPERLGERVQLLLDAWWPPVPPYA